MPLLYEWIYEQVMWHDLYIYILYCIYFYNKTYYILNFLYALWANIFDTTVFSLLYLDMIFLSSVPSLPLSCRKFQHWIEIKWYTGKTEEKISTTESVSASLSKQKRQSMVYAAVPPMSTCNFCLDKQDQISILASTK